MNPKENESFPSPALQEGLLWVTRNPKGTGLSDKENQQSCCAFKKGECQKGNASDYWQSPKHLISPQKEKYFAQAQSGGSLLHGVSGIPVRSISPKIGKKIAKNVPKKSHTLCIIETREAKIVEARTICGMSNSEVVQQLLKRTLNLLARTPGT